MTESVTFKGHITFKDAQRVEKLLSPPKWSKLGMATIGVMAVFGLAYVSIQTSVVFTLVFFVCVGLFIGGCLWVGNWIGIDAKRRAYESGRTERKVTIHPDRLTVKTPVSSTDLEWKAFKKVLFAQDLVVATDGREYLAWAPYNFETTDEWIRAVALSKEVGQELQQAESTVPVKAAPSASFTVR